MREIATSLIKILFDAGYTAYFAGGWVRDLLLEIPTDEIDIATSAPPHIVQALFPKTIPVGAQFGVIIVLHQGIPFEVTTFRKDHPYLDGRHPTTVDYSTPEKDAHRRDFTINGLFFDPLTETIYDYVGGQEDLEKKIIRAIGNPVERFSEDRLRMVRAVRFAARLGFTIEEGTKRALTSLSSTLFPAVSMERIWQELNKMAAYPHFDHALLMLQTFGLLSTIFPSLKGVEIEPFLKPFPYFPYHAPTLVYLLELFPQATLDEKIELCHYLKTSGKEVKLAEFLHHANNLFMLIDVENVEWVYFYAHEHAELALQVQAAKLRERGDFLAEHMRRKERLHRHIERRLERHPLVTSHHLKEHGIAPSQEMGRLLKEAERIAINEDLHDADEVLKRLSL